VNKPVTDILSDECNCQQTESKDIISVVDEVISLTGRESDKVIPILQEVQKRLNYLPSDALKHICRVTDITPGQLSGVSTFYSQFRHIP
jgi:NADH-quinone oxidoreductase subunit F